MTPEVCPCCGAEVPRNAKACPTCGADEETGWSEDARADELGLAAEDFDYEEFVKREFGKKSRVPLGIHWFWWLIGVLVIAAFIFGLLR